VTKVGAEPEQEQWLTDLRQLGACLTSACQWFPSWGGRTDLPRSSFNIVALANMEALAAQEEAVVLASLAGLWWGFREAGVSLKDKK